MLSIAINTTLILGFNYYVGTTSLIPAIIKPQVKDSNAFYIYIEIPTSCFRSQLQTNRSSTAGRVSSFIKQLKEELSRDQHEAKWNIPTVR